MQDYPPGGRPAVQKQQRSPLDRLTELIPPEPENRPVLLAPFNDTYNRNVIDDDALPLI